jgi:G3E family GTPase
VLLINEFGKVSIDGELLIAGNYEKIELNKGSLFCICVRTDFISEVEKIALRIKPELLIIEATGLANTSDMEKMLALPNLINYIHLQACICLVDCLNFPKIKDILEAPITQIQSADLVLINKKDLVSEQQMNQVIDAVKEISSRCQIVPTSYADFPLGMLSEVQHAKALLTAEPGEGRTDPVHSITLERMGCFTQQSWQEFKSSLASNIMRLKGFIFLDDQCYYVDATMDQWHLEKRNMREDRRNRLVIIGQNLDQEQIADDFSKRIL